MKMKIKNPRVFRFLVHDPKFEFNIYGLSQRAEVTISVTFDITNKEQSVYLTDLYNNMQNGNMEEFAVLKFFKKK